LLLASLTLALLPACQQAPSAPKAGPVTVSKEAFGSTIWLGHYRKNGFAGYGSAVIVDAHRLLTNQHFWASTDPWYEAALPQEEELVLLGTAGLQPANFRLVAAGDPTGSGARGHTSGQRQSRSDWVLIETDEPSWRPQQAATLHEAALSPGWEPSLSTRLYVAGYSSSFMSSQLQERLDHGGTLAPETFQSVLSFLEQGPYLLQGMSRRIEGMAVISTDLLDGAPFGHSGGGVYLWNDRRHRMELVGLFHSWAATTQVVTEHHRPLGIGALAYDSTSENEGAVLQYAPLDALPLR